ncbi:MAG: serine hydrolase domain-containing protein [Acidobacteriota bacterium]
MALERLLAFPLRRRRPALLTLVAVLLLAGPTSASTHPSVWGGADCVAPADLRQIVDDAAAAAPAGDFSVNGRGSGASGFSVALSQRGCGRFVYAVGQRDVERGWPMTRRTRQHIGSLTKALTGIIAVRLAAVGAFGAQGLDATVDRFLSAEDLTTLTVGRDPAAPACPADIVALNRLTGVPEPVSATCPNLSTVTLRQLLNGNHGMFDFVNEVDRDGNGFLETDEYALGALLDVLGVPRRTLPPGTDSAFELLAAYGLLAHPGATIGGTGLEDYERTFGTTGHTLFGIIAERVTGLTLDDLLAVAIPLCRSAPPMISLTAPPSPERGIARQYLVTSGADLVGLPEDLFGVYPQVDVAGNPAVNVYDLGPFIVTNSGGAAGSVVATPDAYRRTLRRLLTGRLLGRAAQHLFDASFQPITEMPGVFHGFGLFRFDDPEFGPGYAKSGRVTGSSCQALHFDDRVTTVVACKNGFDAFLGGSAPPSSTPVADLARALVRAAVEGPH